MQSHVRALVVTDAVGRVMVRSLIRLVLRSDDLSPLVFCDPMFFTEGCGPPPNSAARAVLCQDTAFLK